MNNGTSSSSFRDPSGFIFFHEGKLLRQVNLSYKDQYEKLMNSGLYEKLTTNNLLIPHKEVDNNLSISSDNCYKVIEPEMVSFISYPYEWSFSQLKDTALLTLKIQKYALEYGMTLKDSSVYNTQFHNGKPVFIDTLSFETYNEGQPWKAYRQFCQHYFAPLVLMSKVDARLNQLFKIYLDGIPLDLASSLLKNNTYLNFSILSHIHLHAKSQKRYAYKTIKSNRAPKMSKQAFLALLDNLESFITKLTWKADGTEWGNYYEDTNYSNNAEVHKHKLVERFLSFASPKTVWDIGGNTGVFSRIASNKGIKTISFDIDPVAIEKSYLVSKHKNESFILPLLFDITSPSPGIGWANAERETVTDRGPADTIMALALIHHLAISNNTPFEMIADYLQRHCSTLIIEFVPKSDSQVQRLLATREDIFHDYNQENFESTFFNYFKLIAKETIVESERTLYLLSKK